MRIEIRPNVKIKTQNNIEDENEIEVENEVENEIKNEIKSKNKKQEKSEIKNAKASNLCIRHSYFSRHPIPVPNPDPASAMTLSRFHRRLPISFLGTERRTIWRLLNSQ